MSVRVCASQVATKSVAQCVEFYYTYKKHVKIGRNGTLTYGEAEPLESRTTEEETDHKVSLVFKYLDRAGKRCADVWTFQGSRDLDIKQSNRAVTQQLKVQSVTFRVEVYKRHEVTGDSLNIL